jgi:gluconate 2-dehydrogenase gamma chain
VTDDNQPSGPPNDPSRRDAIKALAAAAALSFPTGQPSAAAPAPPRPGGPTGTPSDPDLLRPRIRWTKVLTAGELATLAVLCDTIIPADEHSPAASRVGAPDYIDEFVSAPYPASRASLTQVQGGLRWLDVEGERRFNRPFARLKESERHQICDDICYLPKARPERAAAARFFALIRDLTATAFYTTREGMKDLGYIGNVPRQRFDSPPTELLRKLGLDAKD